VTIQEPDIRKTPRVYQDQVFENLEKIGDLDSLPEEDKSAYAAWKVDRELRKVRAGTPEAWRKPTGQQRTGGSFVTGINDAQELAFLNRLVNATDELARGGIKDPEEAKWFEEVIDFRSREWTIGAQAESLALDMVTHMQDFLLGGKILKTAGVKLATREAMEKAVETWASRRFITSMGRMGLEGAATLATAELAKEGLGALGAPTSSRTRTAYGRDVYQQRYGVGEDEAGELRAAILTSNPDLVGALYRAGAGTLIEGASERLGGHLMKLGPMQRVSAFQHSLLDRFLKKGGTVSGFTRRVLQKGGYDGMVEEFLEERAGDVMGLMTLSKTWAEVAPEADQYAAELIAFAVPGMTVQAARGFQGNPLDKLIQAQTDELMESLAEGEAATLSEEGQEEPAPLEGPGIAPAHLEHLAAREDRDVGEYEELAPRTGEQVLAAQRGKELGTKVRFIKGMVNQGASLVRGEVLISADAVSPARTLFYHEAVHELARRIGGEASDGGVFQLYREIRDVDSEGLAKGRRLHRDMWISAWLHKHGGAQMPEARAAYRKAHSRALMREEGLATYAQDLAGYLELLTSPVGAEHIRRLAQGNPTIWESFKRWLADTYKRLTGRDPERRLAALRLQLGVAPGSTDSEPAMAAQMLNEALRGTAAVEGQGDVKLEVTPAPAPAVEQEQEPEPAPAPEREGGAVGHRSKLELPTGQSLDVEYVIVEAGDLTPSHDPTRGFQKNEGGDINERPYEDPTEGKEIRAMVEKIADPKRSKPALLVTNDPTATGGPPVVSVGGVVLGGNARSMGLQLAYARGNEAAENYREALFRALEQFGFDPDALDAFERPVLVRKIAAGQEGAPGELSRILNQGSMAPRTATADAVSRGAKVDASVAELVGALMGDGTLAEVWSSGNADRLVGALVTSGAFSEADLAQFLVGGKLTKSGKDTIEQLLLASVVPDVRAVASLSPGVKNKLIRSLPGLIRLKVKWPDFTGNLVDAVEALASMRESKLKPAEALMQTTLEPEAWKQNPLAVAMAGGLKNEGPVNLAGLFRELADQVEGKRGLFDEAQTDDPFQATMGVFRQYVVEIPRFAPPVSARFSPAQNLHPSILDLPDIEGLAKLIQNNAAPSQIDTHPAILEAVERMKAIPITATEAGELLDGRTTENREFVFNGERVVGYTNAVERLIAVARDYAEGTVRRERKAIIVLGPPAAGKSTIAEKLAAHMGFAIVDPDDAKKVLPEYDDGIGASATHEESGAIAKRYVLPALLDTGENIMLPKVGGSPKSIRRLVADLQEEGYDVGVVNMAVSAENAYRRMIGRFLSKGRLIDPKYAHAVGDNPTKTYGTLKEEDNANWFAEVGGNQPKGVPPSVHEDLVGALPAQELGWRSGRDRQLARAADVHPAAPEQEAPGDARFSPAPPVDSEAFRKWFGDSKVVDERGEPLVVYHGTPFAGFSAFAERPPRFSLSVFGAHYFSSQPHTGNFFSEDVRLDEQTPGVYPVFLSIRNPLRTEREIHPSDVERAKAEGHDGVIGGVGTMGVSSTDTEYVAFSPTQIKSATGNVGTYDPTNPDIRFAGQEEFVDTPRQLSFELSEVSEAVQGLEEIRGWKAFRRAVQDFAIVIQDWEKAIENAGGWVEHSLRDAIALMAGRAQERHVQLERHRDNILKILRREGYWGLTRRTKLGRLNNSAALQKIGDVIYAHAALERNPWLLENRGVEDGSGMTTEEAEGILDTDGLLPGMQEIADIVFEMNRETRKQMLDTGMITEEEYEFWEKTFPHYAPMRTAETDGEKAWVPSGPSRKGFQLPRVLVHAMEGRRSKADNPFVFSFAQAQGFNIAAEKARVGARMWEILTHEDNVGIVSFNELEQPENPEDFKPENAFGVWVKGERKIIRLSNADVNRAMTKMGVTPVNRIFAAHGAIVRAMSRLITSWNPNFMLPNFFRDLGTALGNLTVEEQKGLRARVLKSIPAAQRAIAAAEFGDKVLDTELGRFYAEVYRPTGGAIGWATDTPFDRMERDMLRQMNRGVLHRALGKMVEQIEHSNAVIEMGVRVAAAYQLTQSGVSAERAVRAARELTVDFNRRGEVTGWLSSWSMFINARVQGAAQILLNTAKNPRGMANVMAGLFAAGAAQHLALYLAMGDDEDDEPLLWKKADWERATNMMIPNPFSDKPGAVYKVPMGYGFNVPWAWGDRMM
jgi:hypothetical protein